MSTKDILASAEARQLVQRIARGYGWISERARNASDQEALDAIDMLQESLGIAVRTLATNLYKSQARFVFELIQNADDNDYTRATSSGAKPYIKFTVYPNKIVIDCNEDGFTTDNVVAICKVGQSTKKRAGVQQYIGEKGIGFKSVFMVSSKVHIQSGFFSFFFEHVPGARGMGLVTPVWEPIEEALPDPLTRMTLSLLEKLDYPDLVSQFDSLPETFLLFLNKLGAITIDKVGPLEESTESTTYSCTLDEPSRRVTLQKTSRKGDAPPQRTLNFYHITRKALSNLPPDEQRDSNTAEVVLAFPLDGDSEPVIGSQEVYAYLPIRDFGYSFLIQSDFVTPASRQDVMESPRNKAILDGIADAFLDAVFQFCSHPTLQYKWPRYIPRNISDPFWICLQDKIHELLKGRDILRGRSHGRLRPISQLKQIAPDFQDKFGNALVGDLEEEMYLALEYQPEDIASLNSLGLGVLDFSAVLARFRNDLILPSSRFKSPETDDDWHTRTAKLLLRPFENKWNSRTPDAVRGLACIPLQNGRWTAITDGAIFFPHTDGTVIPTDLGLRIVDEESITNPSRKMLFVTLGVKYASTQDVRALILARYKKRRISISLQTSVKDLHFLYWTHSPSVSTRLRESTSLYIFNHRYQPIRDGQDLYLHTDEEYGFQELMGLALEEAPYNNGLVGSFIHPEYFKSVPSKRGEYHPTFNDWLQECVGILYHPRLVDPKDPTQLSPVFRYIIEARPEKLLGTLKAHWSSYAGVINVDLASKISEAKVRSTNIGLQALNKTFIPSEMLTARCDEFLEIQKFPFLRLENESDIEGWKFLSVFHVGIEDDLDFWLQVLYYCKLSKGPFRYEIYEVIQRKVRVSSDPQDKKKVRRFIDRNDLILAPSCHGGPSIWTCQWNCLWDAPDYMTIMHPLRPAMLQFNNALLKAFFRNTLNIKNVTWLDLTDELEDIQEKDKPDMKVVQDIYLRLQRISAGLGWEDIQSLQTHFEEDALIFDMLGKTWTSPSACLWSKDAQVPGKSTISGQYEDLKELFVGVLKVKIPDLRLLVEELERVAQSSPSIDDIKSLIWQINLFAPTGEDLDRLRGSEIFPVRKADGTSELRTRLARFSITDRQPWADAFEGKLDFLDFSLKEVRVLEPFLSSMELRGYLSEDVIEKSSFQGILPEPSIKRTRHLQRRAHALSRCATHFDSPRTKNDSQTLYQLLLHAKVYETDGIVGCLQHTLLGETTIVETSKIKLHIEEKQECLNVYVPKDSKDQEICYLRLLPTKLFNETMMAEIDRNSTLATDPSAVSIITAIFASSDGVIDLVLEEAGIVPVAYPDQYEEELQQLPSDDMSGSEFESEADLETETKSVGSGTSIGIPTPGASTTSAGSASFSIMATSTYRASYQPSSQPQPVRILSSPPRPSRKSVSLDNARSPSTPGRSHAEYRRLLDNVITAARNKRGGFPSKGSFNLGELLDALPVEASRDASSCDLPFGVRNENQIAHDMKVGAAGELYAFEILSRLETSLPEFSRDDWQSTIRRHVTIHEDYRDMDPWRGAETADITYDDTKGEFTQLLIANGYLDGSIWAYARPKYFLEVKTTTKECATRFFLSKSQYQRMQRMKLGVQATAEVYIILRVFNLESDRIDMRLYVDPAGMEERGELQFTSESYSAVPSAREGP